MERNDTKMDARVAWLDGEGSAIGGERFMQISGLQKHSGIKVAPKVDF